MASEILGMPSIGGPGTGDSFLAVALGRHGHQVELLVAPGRDVDVSPEWKRIYADAGVHIRPLEAALRVRPDFLQPATAVFDALRANPPDVVIADDWRGLAYAALRSRQLGRSLAETAFVVYCHGPARVLAEAARKVPDTLARFGEEVAQRACIELADVVVSPSEWLLGWMRDHRWPEPRSARVIPNLWQSVALGEAPAQAPPASSVKRIVFFGQLREGKGVFVLITALQALEPQLLDGIELVFLGRETPRWTAERVRDALGPKIARRVASIRFETRLERSAALRELLLPGSLAVMPSLLENSPYAVAECLEHGIPFIAGRSGGVKELLAEEDRERVLIQPTADDLAAALTRALSATADLAPARPARAPTEALEAWLELIEGVARARAAAAPPATSVAVVACGREGLRHARRLAEQTRSVSVEVVAAASRRGGLDRATAEWVAFLDDDDEPDPEMLDALVAAQAAANADVVTTAVRPAGDPGAVHVFLGNPGALGLVENHYGVVGLLRRSSAARQPLLDDGVDADWPLFARLALAGDEVVSIPEPLSTHSGRPGRMSDVPGEGLAVLEAFEAIAASNDLPQLTATLAAAAARADPTPAAASRWSRGIRLLRREGIVGVSARLLDRKLVKSPKRW